MVRRFHKSVSLDALLIKAPLTEFVKSAACSVALAVALVVNGAQAVKAGQQFQPNFRTVEQAFNFSPRRPLLAHVRFCIFYEGQCDVQTDRRDPATTIHNHYAEMVRINRTVNRMIRPRPDGSVDTWDINVSEGDCEDYALQKRAELIAQGWPTDALRIAAVRMHGGNFHAILLVRVGDTDYVLDNLTSRVVPWNETPYQYLMIQDRNNPRSWHDVIPQRAQPLTS